MTRDEQERLIDLELKRRGGGYGSTREAYGEAVELHPCGYCGARPGWFCVSRDGEILLYHPHGKRLRRYAEETLADRYDASGGAKRLEQSHRVREVVDEWIDRHEVGISPTARVQLINKLIASAVASEMGK
jgi:hypothetical protein